MLYYDRIDVHEGINVNKTSGAKECNIYHYWFFLKKVLISSKYLQRKPWFIDDVFEP